MKPTVLVADGDAELCELYQMFLSDYGYEVETATDGLECLKKLREIRPSVLVLDLELHWGGADGVLAWLRQEHFLSELPVILTATAGYRSAEVDSIRAKVVARLFKPFAPDELLESLRVGVGRQGEDLPVYRSRVTAC